MTAMRTSTSLPTGIILGLKQLTRKPPLFTFRPMTLSGRHALVTGGSRGIGLAIVRALAAAGASVTALGRDPARLSATCADGFVVADVTDAAGLMAAMDTAQQARGPLDILVNNAGGAESAPLTRSDDAMFLRMWELNVMSAVRATRHVLPGMAQRGAGRIVNVASTAGVKGYAYVSAYVAAKHALVGFTRAAALEVATRGVTVNAVCPGFTDTDLLAGSLDRAAGTTGRPREQVAAEFLRHNPQQRFVTPEEVAAAVVYLCAPQAGAVTGHALAIAGGEI
jgi:NAD(P)-dependent dehydrogenase (short-subunit alcohol dehydrogenase family)